MEEVAALTHRLRERMRCHPLPGRRRSRSTLFSNAPAVLIALASSAFCGGSATMPAHWRMRLREDMRIDPSIEAGGDREKRCLARFGTLSAMWTLYMCEFTEIPGLGRHIHSSVSLPTLHDFSDGPKSPHGNGLSPRNSLTPKPVEFLLPLQPPTHPHTRSIPVYLPPAVIPFHSKASYP